MSTKQPDLSRSANAKLEGAGADQPAKLTLQQSVALWQKSSSNRTQADGEQLHNKFVAAEEGLATYGSVKEFFAGLEGQIGSPSADLMTAMAQDHASDESFPAFNAGKMRVTTPRAEWTYVKEGRAGEPEDGVAVRERQPSHVMDATGGRAGWRLQDFANQPEVVEAGLMLEEVAGLRLYTGPMFDRYNSTLRSRTKGAFVTTLHAINSGIVKLSKQTKATTVYRGVSGRALPQEFFEPNEHGVMGGVELAFMSTSADRDVALGYMRQNGKTAKILFEIRMGMIDRGADVTCLSQFPGEREILFAPLTGLEVAAVPRDELGVLVIELRLSCNLHDHTLEQVVGKMQASHFALLDGMLDDLRFANVPRSVLAPLEQVKASGQERGLEFFNEPEQYLEATKEALVAKDACFAALATEAAWAGELGEGSGIAARMRAAAGKCARARHPKESATLLMMAAARVGVPKEHEDRVAQACQGLTAQQRLALEALSLLLSTHGAEGAWTQTLIELGTRGGDRHTVGRVAEAHGLSPSTLWSVAPLSAYADLPLDLYKAQPYFHQIDSTFPGLQLVSEEPFIFIVPDFLAADECTKLMMTQQLSAKQQPSATGEKQQEVRTSTTVFAPQAEVSWLRERIAKLANVSEAHLEPTKLTHYAKSEFFKAHLDSSFQIKKNAWADDCMKQLKGGQAASAKLLDEQQPCWWPARNVTIFIYLNDVPDGGHSSFSHLQRPGAEYYKQLTSLYRDLGITVPSYTARGSDSQKLSFAPKAGMAVVHFPATTQQYMCLPDPNTLHEGEIAISPKYIAQQFIWSSPIDPEAAHVHEYVRNVWKQVLARAD